MATARPPTPILELQPPNPRRTSPLTNQSRQPRAPDCGPDQAFATKRQHRNDPLNDRHPVNLAVASDRLRAVSDTGSDQVSESER